MEKQNILTPLEDSTTRFRINGESWIFSTGWGEVMLTNVKSKELFTLDLRTSSVLNLTLILFALKKEKPDVSYELTANLEEEKCVLVINTKLEALTYTFVKKGGKDTSAFASDLQILTERCGNCKEKLPLVGTFKPKKWVEYSVQDIIADFDYSSLNLKKTPLVFTEVVGKPAYTAIWQNN